MNKKNFIKILREKLSILEESEVNDIILEYEAIIEDKIKDGVTEEQSIKDFGDIDELTSGILKAYKINSKFTAEKEENLGKDFESLIKKGASKLASVTRDIVESIKANDADFSVQSIFEIVLKALALLIIVAVMRLPFMFVSHIGEGIFNFTFFPVNHILSIIWNIIIFAIYIITCILIGIAMFKNSIGKSSIKEEVRKEVKTKKQEKTKSEVKKKEDIKVEYIKKEVKVENNGLGVLLTIIKIVLTILFTIPLIFTCIVLGSIIGVILYYILIGINLFGPLFILIGLFIFFCYLADILIKLFSNKKKHYLLPLIFSFCFIFIGGLITFESVRHFEYFDKLDHQVFPQFKEVIIIDSSKTLEFDDEEFIIEKMVDNSLDNDQIKIEYTYYNDLNKVNTIEDNKRFKLYISDYMNNKSFWTIYDDQINNLKNNKIYSYDELHYVDIVIYGNAMTLTNLKINLE